MSISSKMQGRLVLSNQQDAGTDSQFESKRARGLHGRWHDVAILTVVVSKRARYFLMGLHLQIMDIRVQFCGSMSPIGMDVNATEDEAHGENDNGYHANAASKALESKVRDIAS